MRGGRPPKESPRPPHAADKWQHHHHLPPPRDSDANSFCSSSRLSTSSLSLPHRTSSAIGTTTTAAAVITDQSFKHATIRSINAYLASHNVPISLSLRPIPSAKDVADTLKFVLSRLDYSTEKLEEDLPVVLRHLNCPFKLSKSGMKAMSTPHGFPQLLAALGWLVQIADYHDHLEMQDTAVSFRADAMMAYALESYGHYLRGADTLVDAVDEDFVKKLQHEKDSLMQDYESRNNQIRELEKELESYKSRPTPKEVLENEKKVLEEDIKKFQDYIGDLTGGTAAIEKALEEKERELSAKLEELKLISDENEVLKRRIETQGISSRDAERMKKEIQALDKEIAETNDSCNTWEEKCWNLNSVIAQNLKELEMLTFENNEAIKKLKLGADFQYKLNPNGSTPVEVIGLDFKSTVGPMLESLAMKHSSKSKLEELVAIQKQATEMNSRIQAKKNRLVSLESHINDVETQIESIKTEMQASSSRCAAEARRLIEDAEMESLKLERMEREALDTLKAEELKYQETVRQTDEEVRLCVNELLATIDSVSKYKERMESCSCQIKQDLAEGMEFVSNAYKSTMSLTLST